MAGHGTTKYQRLRGGGPRRKGLFPAGFSRCRLYLGTDHILAVDNHRFSEDYKRFYFRDIQAFVIRRDNRLLVSAAIQAVVLLIFLALGLAALSEPFRVFWWSVASICLIFLVINLLRGPTCTCRITTAVQEDVLPSLNRIEVTRKVIDGTLRPLIERAQGKVQPGDLAAAAAAGVATRWKDKHASVTGMRQEDKPVSVTGRVGRSERRASYRGMAHAIAFSLLIADGILTGTGVINHSPITMALSKISGSTAVVCVIVSLVKQRGSLLSRGIRRTAWTAFAFICLSFVLAYMRGLVTAVQTHGSVTDQMEVYQAILNTAPQGSPFAIAVFVFEAAGAFILGAVGLVLTLRKVPPPAVKNGSADVVEAAHKT
jgi:hypothetical protein